MVVHHCDAHLGHCLCRRLERLPLTAPLGEATVRRGRRSIDEEGQRRLELCSDALHETDPRDVSARSTLGLDDAVSGECAVPWLSEQGARRGPHVLEIVRTCPYSDVRNTACQAQVISSFEQCILRSALLHLGERLGIT